MNKWILIFGSMLGVAALGCGGNEAGTPSASASSSLDGAWDLVFTGGPYQTGTLSVSGATGILTLDGGRCGGHEGISATLSSDGENADGNDDCGGAFTITKSSSAVSAFGGIGGTWRFGSESAASCTMTISGSTFLGSCAQNGEVDRFLVGDITGTLSADGKTLAGSTTASGTATQFAATRR
ncbi:MAG: hypothetical protein ABI183_09165 [Polyangiaceae bacterium]